MRVRVDEAGETSGVRKIERGYAAREFRGRRSSNRSDGAIGIKENDLVCEHLTGTNIEQLAAAEAPVRAAAAARIYDRGRALAESAAAPWRADADGPTAPTTTSRPSGA